MMLTPAQARQIKARLWYGEIYSTVAPLYGCSYFTIREISQGRRWADAPWPDGSSGAMPKARRSLVDRARIRAKNESVRTMNLRVRTILEEH